MFRLFLFKLLFSAVIFRHVQTDRIPEEETLDQKSISAASEQLFQDNNTAALLNEQLLLMNKMLKGIEVIVENSNTIRDALEKKTPSYIESCEDVDSSGVYKLLIDSSPVPREVFCEARAYGGEWIVIQQRLDGSLDFNRSWAEYRDGFGTVGNATEFWLGLEAIHQLTNDSSPYELLIELRNEQGKYGFARYKKFKIEGENGGYEISRFNSYEGTIGNMLGKFNKFSTYDRDNDKNKHTNCAEKYGGGWWYSTFMISSTLNGPFIKDADTDQGIFWHGWTKAATYSRMMIREKSIS